MAKRKHWSEQESSAFKETKKIYEEGRKESLGKKDGVWRTVKGRHVFIEEGKTLEQALGHKPGVENQKKIEMPDEKNVGDKVKIKNPLSKGEEKIEYIVTNVNEKTRRAYIRSTNTGLSIEPTELVSLDDIVKIKRRKIK